jgi:uncharacterized Zn-binding protein involved in type VI secretion
MHRLLRRTALLVLATALLGVGACSSSAGSANSSNAAPAAPQAERGAPAAGAGSGGAANDTAPNANTGDQTAKQVEPVQRDLIYTGTITVKVNDVVAAANNATNIVTALGGIVGADTRTLGATKSEDTATLVLRVPSNTFTSTLDALAKLGDEESRHVQTDDVTDTLTDLDARVATQQASVDRIRELMTKAQSISDITSIESELTRRQADLDSLLQRRAKLAGLVALSTITLNLHGPSAPAVVAKDDSGFLSSLKSGWHGFVVSLSALIKFVLYVLPWAAAIGLVLLIVWFVRRKRPSRVVKVIPVTEVPASQSETVTPVVPGPAPSRD